MRQHPFKVVLLLLALLCYDSAAGAQEVPASWVKVAPEGEAFTVFMPNHPSPQKEQRTAAGLSISGQRYSVRDESDGATYTVWSFKRDGSPPEVENDMEAYLDACAELAWDMLVQPALERIGKTRGFKQGDDYRLAYQRELPSPTHPGRHYLLAIGKRRGAAHIYVADKQIYIVTARAAPADAGEVPKPELFLKSFSFGSQLLEETAVAAGIGPGRGSNNDGEGSKVDGGTARRPPADSTQLLSAKEVSQKARILRKPEPLYTESARKFLVTGTVRLRVVLSASGQIEGISVASRLPHGLTQEAIKAAQKTEFEPAIKDGQFVSQYVMIEYNFNIY